MVVHYPRIVWKNCYAEHKVTGHGKTYQKKKIDHTILCTKLALYGLDTNSLKWCENYLSNRKQFVRMEGVKSSALSVTVGVPQGPFLCIVYINENMYCAKIYTFTV